LGISGGQDVRKPRNINVPVIITSPFGYKADITLSSTFGFGAAFVLTQVALSWMPPWLGAAVSVPTSTLLFWCLAPFLVDITKADMQAAVLFMCVGLLFPATVTLLNFESNRLMGPNIAGAITGFGIFPDQNWLRFGICDRNGFPMLTIFSVV
jgi:hypothetical protein